jgi:hypothetical protein
MFAPTEQARSMWVHLGLHCAIQVACVGCIWAHQMNNPLDIPHCLSVVARADPWRRGFPFRNNHLCCKGCPWSDCPVCWTLPVSAVLACCASAARVIRICAGNVSSPCRTAAEGPAFTSGSIQQVLLHCIGLDCLRGESMLSRQCHIDLGLKANCTPGMFIMTWLPPAARVAACCCATSCQISTVLEGHCADYA